MPREDPRKQRELRLGLLGGTFDPPHIGHLVIAQQCRHVLDLDEIHVIVTGHPPHKESTALTPFRHRFEMARRAFGEDPGFLVDPLEGEREGATYTVQTLRAVRKRHGEDPDYWLILGSDSLMELDTWKDPDEIVRLCRLAVYLRPGYEEGRDFERWRPHVDVVDGPLIDVSSTQLRGWIHQGRSARYLVSDAVLDYIRAEGLYAAPR
jgi:nicotinate-nucleotide adenylyltransferase